MAKKPARKQRIMFVDAKNDLISQLAEYFTNRLFGGTWEAYSAAPESDMVDCEMISVMYEAGEDIRRQISKDFNNADHLPSDGEYNYVVFFDKGVFDEWSPRTPWKGKQILCDLGSLKDYKFTDDREMAEAYSQIIAKVRSWVEENMCDEGKLKASVSA